MTGRCLQIHKRIDQILNNIHDRKKEATKTIRRLLLLSTRLYNTLCKVPRHHYYYHAHADQRCYASRISIMPTISWDRWNCRVYFLFLAAIAR